MNFKHINETLGEQVHVWGICSWQAPDGTWVNDRIAVKKIADFVTRKQCTQVKLLAQSMADISSLFVETFQVKDILPGLKDQTYE